MAVVLDALASYVLDMLSKMGRDEVQMLFGVSGEIEKMGTKLNDLKSFLADADRRNITDQSVQAWVGELRMPCMKPQTSSTSASSRPWSGVKAMMQGVSTPCYSACGVRSTPTKLATA
ncbi:unnamed protein product [Urochloa humidicola]